MESSSKSMVSLDPAWPKISIAEANAALTAPGARFEMETVLVGGIATRVWKNAPHDLGALLDLSRTHGERLFTILDDERITFEANSRATSAIALALRGLSVGKGDFSAFRILNLPKTPM